MSDIKLFRIGDGRVEGLPGESVAVQKTLQGADGSYSPMPFRRAIRELRSPRRR
jgi:hypothetical protein